MDPQCSLTILGGTSTVAATPIFTTRKSGPFKHAMSAESVAVPHSHDQRPLEPARQLKKIELANLSKIGNRRLHE